MLRNILTSWSLRAKLPALLLLLFLPACGVIVWSGLKYQEYVLLVAEKNISLVVQGISSFASSLPFETDVQLVGSDASKTGD
jgi:hypothetical protein